MRWRTFLLALEAIDVTRSADDTVLPEVEEALHRAVIASRLVLTEEDLGGTVDWSPDGVFVTEGPRTPGSTSATRRPAFPFVRGSGTRTAT